MSVTGMMGEASLPRVCSPQEAAALSDVFERCERSLYRYAVVRCGNDHLAEDLLQQLWVQASSAARRPPAEELEYWLRAILANLIRSHWRREARRPSHVPLVDPALASELAEQISTADLPEDLLARQEVRDQLLLAITALPAADQELIVGVYFEERSQADLAEALGLSIRAVEGRLYRARTALKQTLAHLV